MRNTEHLRNYFLGKDPQLKETMSDNALRLCGIQGKYYVLRTELMKQLTDLKTLLESADEILQGNIDTEALARQNADNALESKMPFKKLTADITIPENSELNPLLLSTGWWYTGEHVIYYGESVEPTIHNNALFYINAEAGDQWFYFLPPNLDDGLNQLGTYLWFDNTDHIWQYSGYGVVTIIDNHSTDMSIPTAGAVYEFVNGSYVKSSAIRNIWKGSQEAYDAITTKDPNTLYLIEEE